MRAHVRFTFALALHAVVLAACAGLPPGTSAAAFAQNAAEYPAKPIRVLVPFPAGGISDVLARALGARLAASLAQPVIIENRPGAGTTIAADALAKSPPDGYTLMMQDMATHAINPALYAKLPFDSMRDFTMVAPVAASPLMLVVKPDAQVKTVSDLVALGKSRPGQLGYGSSGNGTLPHLVGEAFKKRADADFVHVPYKGQTAQFVITGEVAWTFSVMPPAVAAMKGGKLAGLAVTSPRRVSAAPDVPTMGEAGFAGFDFMLVSGVLAPPALPRPILSKLNAEIAKAAASAEMATTLGAIGAEAVSMTPERFTTFVASEIDRLGAIAKASGAKLD